MLGITVKLWEDGVKHDQELEQLDRWTIQAAEEVTVLAADLPPLLLFQSPRMVPANMSGVGALLWESAFVLAAHLVSQPAYSFVGSKAVELGSGLGLAGMMLARLGAQVTLTDLKKVIDLTQISITQNHLHHRRYGMGSADVMILDWAAASSQGVIDDLASRNLDFVIAADSCYDDQDGTSPDPSAFFNTCRRLCSIKTTCLLALERRQESTYAAFMTSAQQAFTQVSRLPHPSGSLFEQSHHIELWAMQNRR